MTDNRSKDLPSNPEVETIAWDGRAWVPKDDYKLLQRALADWKQADTDRCLELFDVRERHGNALIERDRLQTILNQSIKDHEHGDRIFEENDRLRGALERTHKAIKGHVDRWIGVSADIIPPPVQTMVTLCNELHSVLNRPAHETSEKVWDVPSGWRDKEPWFKVGDRVLPLNALHRLDPVHTITEITERGFKYKHERFNLGTRIGWTEGGETFEPSQYELAAVETKPHIMNQAERDAVNRALDASVTVVPVETSGCKEE